MGAGSQDFTGMVASCVPGLLGTQYGTLMFAHFPQAPVAWLSMFTKGARMSHGHWPLFLLNEFL